MISDEGRPTFFENELLRKFENEPRTECTHGVSGSAAIGRNTAYSAEYRCVRGSFG
jgi:hypothetical protein